MKAKEYVAQIGEIKNYEEYSQAMSKIITKLIHEIPEIAEQRKVKCNDAFFAIVKEQNDKFKAIAKRANKQYDDYRIKDEAFMSCLQGLLPNAHEGYAIWTHMKINKHGSPTDHMVTVRKALLKMMIGIELCR